MNVLSQYLVDAIEENAPVCTSFLVVGGLELVKETRTDRLRCGMPLADETPAVRDEVGAYENVAYEGEIRSGTR